MVRAANTHSQSHRSSATSKADKIREEEAAVKAERLLNTPPIEPPIVPSPPAQQEPSLKERMANVDRRMAVQAAEEKRLLAVAYLTETRHKFVKALGDHPDLLTMWNDLKDLEKLAATTPGSTPPPAVHSGRASGALTEAANKILACLNKTEPVSVSSVKEQIQIESGLIQAALAKLKRENKIKTNGQRGLNSAWLLV